MKYLITMLMLAISLNAYSSAEVRVYCRGYENPKIWQVNDVQDGRDFLRIDCPDCVWKVVVEEVCIAGLDPDDCVPGAINDE